MRLIARVLVGIIDRVNAMFEPFKPADMSNIPDFDAASFYEFAKSHVAGFLSSGGIFHDQKPDDIGDGLFYNALYQCWRIWDFPTKDTADVALSTLRGYFTEFGCLVRGMCARGVVKDVAHRPFYAENFIADSDIGPGPLILWCYALTQIKALGHHDMEIRQLAIDCLTQLKKNNYWLLNPDGTKSIYGNLKPSFTQAPLQTLAVMLLAQLANDDVYDTLFKKYGWKIEYADVHLLTWHPWYSEMIAFLAYDALLQLELGIVKRKAYLRGLKRLFNVTKNQCNGLFYSIYSKYFGNTHAAETVVKWNLYNFNTTHRNRMATNNSIRPEIEKTMFGDKKVAIRPLLISERPSRNFEWNKNPYQLDGSTTKLHTYLDYLFLYAYPKEKLNDANN